MNLKALGIDEIYFAAMERKSPEELASYLDEVCGADPDLRRRVERLLEVQSQVGSFLESPALRPTVTVDSPKVLEGPGTIIGPYKLLEVIGEGGMGLVFMAEQTQPVRRKVALKIIKPGMDTRQVIARFEAERQALALMDHPNIARVLDAGATESGRPYFVMELVRGIPITDYSDQAKLAIPERLELFVQVCRAVQHAHQKGVIHRDLKPSNILVTLIDGVPVPKVIDFGIAKATGQSLTERTLYTGFAQLVGTPLYLSPEQAELSGVDVDTRSDIYSLGALLYELLTGTTPFAAETFRQAAFDEIRRLIREQEPPTPSSRLSTLVDPQRSSVSAARHADARQLNRSVRGELDWIVMKALEKDRRRRYETANDFAADIMRHLTDQPVEACPPSAGYRLAKFARRNRAALTMAAIVTASLSIVSVGSVVSAYYFNRLAERERESRVAAVAAQKQADIEAERANNEANRANSALAETEQAREEAERQVAHSQEVVDFFIKDILGLADPTNAPGEVVTVVEALARADARIEERFAAQPLVEASIRMTMARTYSERGQADESMRHVRRALALRMEHLGPEHRETLRARFQFAESLCFVSQDNGPEATALIEQVRDIQRRVLGPEDRDTLLTQWWIGVAYRNQHRYAEARAVLEPTLEAQRRMLGPESDETLDTMAELGNVYSFLGESDQARQLLEEALEIQRRVLAPDHPDTIRTLQYLGWALLRAGRLEEAEPILAQALAMKRRVLDPGHRSRLWSAGLYAQVLVRLGKLEVARQLIDRELEALDRARGPDHPGTPEDMIRTGSPLTIDAPYRATSPVADGRIEPDEYSPGPGLDVDFMADLNPGRFHQGSATRTKPREDLSYRLRAAHTATTLFLAFEVRDQSVWADPELAQTPFHNDSVEVFLDGDRVANDLVPPFNLGWSGEGVQLVADTLGNRYTSAAIFTAADWEVGTATTRDGYVIEFAIPLGLIDTQDGPGAAPARTGSVVLMNAGITDKDEDVIRPTQYGQAHYGILWAEDPAMTPYFGGEDYWPVALRLTPASETVTVD